MNKTRDDADERPESQRSAAAAVPRDAAMSEGAMSEGATSEAAMSEAAMSRSAMSEAATSADERSPEERLAEALRFLSHDVREGHSSTLALLELQRIKPDPMPMSALIERVERNARRSLAAIDDFLDLARARSQPLRLEEIDLADLLVEVVADAWAPAQQRGIRVHVVDTPESVAGWGDRELLGGALAKLLRDVVARAVQGAELRCALRGDAQERRIEIEGGAAATPASPASAATMRNPAAPAAAAPKPARRDGPASDAGVALARLVAQRLRGALTITAATSQGTRYTLCLPQPTVDAQTTIAPELPSA